MSRINYFIVLLIFSVFFSGCKKTEVTSHWSNQPFTIDGHLDEWTGYPLQHFEDEFLSVSLRNDSSNLYLILATRDKQLMSRVQRSGIKVWFNNENKKKKNFGIHYYGEANLEQILSKSFTPDRFEQLPEERKEFLKLKREEMRGKLNIIKNKLSFLIDNSSDKTPVVADDIYKGTYLVEIKMPFQKDSSMIYALQAAPGDKIAIGVELSMPEFDRKKKGERPEGMGGGMGGGGGRGGMGGGGHGGMGGGQSGMSRQMFNTKTEIWFTTRLETP